MVCSVIFVYQLIAGKDCMEQLLYCRYN